MIDSFSDLFMYSFIRLFSERLNVSGVNVSPASGKTNVFGMSELMFPRCSGDLLRSYLDYSMFHTNKLHTRNRLEGVWSLSGCCFGQFFMIYYILVIFLFVKNMETVKNASKSCLK